MEDKPEFKKQRPVKLYTKPEITQVLLKPEASVLEFCRGRFPPESWQGVCIPGGGTRPEDLSSRRLKRNGAK
jgi:hypothetical protein